MLKTSNYLILGFVLILIYACSPEEGRVVFDEGYDYQPLGIGKYWEYSYDSIIYDNEGAKIDTFSGFIRKEITDTLSNGQFKINSFIKRKLADEWRVLRADRIFIENNQLFTSEGNFLFANMSFPLEVGRIWDGNAYFDNNTTQYVAGEAMQIYRNWEYQVDQKLNDYTASGNVYDDVVVIEQAGIDNNNIEYRISKEFYAKDIGLIAKVMEIYDTQNADTSIAWIDRVHNGYSLDLQLISHN